MILGFSFYAPRVNKVLEVKYLSPVGSMIKFWRTTFWFLWNLKHHNHATFMNQKVVIQNFIIEPTGDKYFSAKNVSHVWQQHWQTGGKFQTLKNWKVEGNNFIHWIEKRKTSEITLPLLTSGGFNMFSSLT